MVVYCIFLLSFNDERYIIVCMSTIASTIASVKRRKMSCYRKQQYVFDWCIKYYVIMCLEVIGTVVVLLFHLEMSLYSCKYKSQWRLFSDRGESTVMIP